MTHPADPSEQFTNPELLHAHIEQSREELADTVAALAAKVNIKAQAKHKLDEAGERAKDATARAKDATLRAKQATPPGVQHAIDVAGEKAAPVARETARRAAPYRKQIIIGSVAFVVLVRILRRHKD